MLQNAYLLAKIGADTAENERNFAKNWQLLRLVYERSGDRPPPPPSRAPRPARPVYRCCPAGPGVERRRRGGRAQLVRGRPRYGRLHRS